MMAMGVAIAERDEASCAGVVASGIRGDREARRRGLVEASVADRESPGVAVTATVGMGADDDSDTDAGWRDAGR